MKVYEDERYMKETNKTLEQFMESESSDLKSNMSATLNHNLGMMMLIQDNIDMHIMQAKQTKKRFLK